MFFFFFKLRDCIYEVYCFWAQTAGASGEAHLLQVHLIWALFVSEDPAGSSQRNHDDINIPVGAEADK